MKLFLQFYRAFNDCFSGILNIDDASRDKYGVLRALNDYAECLVPRKRAEVENTWKVLKKIAPEVIDAFNLNACGDVQDAEGHGAAQQAVTFTEDTPLIAFVSIEDESVYDYCLRVCEEIVKLQNRSVVHPFVIEFIERCCAGLSPSAAGLAKYVPSDVCPSRNEFFRHGEDKDTRDFDVVLMVSLSCCCCTVV